MLVRPVLARACLSHLRGRWHSGGAADAAPSDGGSARVESLHLDWAELTARMEEMEQNVAARQLGEAVPVPVPELVAWHRRHSEQRQRYDAVQHQRREVARALPQTQDAGERAALAAQGKA